MPILPIPSCLLSLSQTTGVFMFSCVSSLQTQVDCLLPRCPEAISSSVLVQSNTSCPVLARAIDTNASAAAFLVSRPLSPEWPTKMDMFLFFWLIILGVMIVFAFAGILILMIPIIDPERATQNANR